MIGKKNVSALLTALKSPACLAGIASILQAYDFKKSVYGHRLAINLSKAAQPSSVRLNTPAFSRT